MSPTVLPEDTPLHGEGWSKVPLPFWKRGVEVNKKEALTEPWVAYLRDRRPRCVGFNIGMVVRGDWKLMMGIQWSKVGAYLSKLVAVIIISEGEIPIVGRNSKVGVNRLWMWWWRVRGGYNNLTKGVQGLLPWEKRWNERVKDVVHHLRALYTYQNNKIMGFGLYKT